MSRGRRGFGPNGRASTTKRKRLEESGTESRLEGHRETSTPSSVHKKVRWEHAESVSDEDNAEEDTDQQSALTDKLCLAISCQFGRIGCAYYDPVKFTIYVFEDAPENQHFDLTKLLLDQCGPDILLTSSKADDNFIDMLSDHMEATGGTFQIRPHKDFSPGKGRDRLLSLRLLSELSAEVLNDRSNSGSESSADPRNAYDFMRRRRETGGDPTMQRWNASIRLANHACVDSSPLCLGSTGALLDHLARIRAVGDLEDEGIGGIEVRAIQALALSQAMQINADALFSLQIFEDESHASIHSDKTKEGLSLFGILNNTKTTLGRALMREWLTRPSLSLSVISARHDAVECFLRPDNLGTATLIHTHLKGIKNIPRILAVMQAGRAKVSDWQGLVKFTYHALMIRDALVGLNSGGSADVVKRLVDIMDAGSFKTIGTAINDVIDWEESANTGRVCVKPHVDEELDDLKRIYHGIDTVLSKVAQQISATVPPDYASSLNVVYFPQLGFLICVPMLEEWKTDAGITVLEGWSFQFSSESHVYFKSQEMHDMDAHIGDLHPMIVDREIEIVQSLLEKILVFKEVVSHVCDACAELDCLLSFAEASRACNYNRPHMVDDNIIDIRQGRHPLQEMVVDTFVPNDAFAVGGCGFGCDSNPDDINTRDESSVDNTVRREQNGIIVCTGANACGKSVYLKQVALIQYMAQIGCFVPADAATLGIVDKIFTRIQTRESVSTVQSTFMIDLNQVSLALRNATERSLILLDEFGKGTASAGSYIIYTYGAGLLCGIIKHLADRGPACPKVFAATHFHNIFCDGLLDPSSIPITFLHMQILLTSNKGQLVGASDTTDDYSSGEDMEGAEDGNKRMAPGERLTYLYRVAEGLSLNSHAALCAEVFGIPRRIAKRAQYVSKLMSSHELGRLLDEEMRDEECQDLENAEEVCRRLLARDLSSDDERENVRSRLKEILGR
ncbi:uncharacterized protein LAESUDRAFT_670086 [Laetiporus sulphureus 93-53]|uniref:DNA mismatch repair proteins mutS family domain-containing protein n=1 Tax=Laetiporus sulphureus 93-53 TaxID=1314785 RepID=A0A165HM35_9APHY|nr:uncharacterized protein LAESUDRAFT_670086 [Laetiporus sulphureus 93-53]KZT11913.1 hypothetical protein LAESUDRAFT_670086 [Laetiporus sulphureus 93-53]